VSLYNVGGSTAGLSSSLYCVMDGLTGQPAKPGRIAVADRSGAPQHRLRHTPVFLSDWLLCRTGVLCGRGHRPVSFTERDRQLLWAPLTLGARF
jgi:hypothetical protein